MGGGEELAGGVGAGIFLGPWKFGEKWFVTCVWREVHGLLARCGSACAARTSTRCCLSSTSQKHKTDACRGGVRLLLRARARRSFWHDNPFSLINKPVFFLCRSLALHLLREGRGVFFPPLGGHVYSFLSFPTAALRVWQTARSDEK